MLWLDTYKQEEKTETGKDAILENGDEVGHLAKNLFGPYIDIAYSNNLEEMIEKTKKDLEENEDLTLTEASFTYQDNFCSVDILRKKKETYEIYEVKSSTEIKDIYLDDISYQYYVLTHLGLKVEKANLVHINSKYERNGKLELEKLFNIKDVTKMVKEKQKETEERIKKINEYMKQKEEPEKILGIYCQTPYECPFFTYCTRALPQNNIFHIKRMRNQTKFKYYQKGSFTYEDLLKEKIDDKTKEQIEFELYNKDSKINKKEIKEFLNTLTYPIYFLDFETYQQSIPKYDGIKPYEQIPFQYSLHYIEKEGGKLKHKEFLSKPDIDPRRDLATSLVKDIPKDVCVLAYNMSFEKTVIKNLANLYPDLKEHLMNIRENIKDLMIPFYNRSYYTKDMKGSYSIKYVLPALFPNEPALNYHNLEGVHNGSEAMAGYASMGSLKKEEQERLRHNLLKYCELDTYAMVKIWEKLKEI